MTDGILYVCATPIGNLSDISAHVVDTLREVDLIAAEDTRNSIKLLNHFEIKTPMTSYHEYNRFDKAVDLIRQIHEGKSVALISDAGTPAISDPGEVLVKMCLDENIKVTSLPGPCACITALSMSGMSSRRFSFEGFLPSDKKERNKVIDQLKQERRTIIIYEAPHHLKATLSLLNNELGDREIAICKELTKKHEKCIRMRLPEACSFYEENEPKGEYVLVIAGKSDEEIIREERKQWEEMSIQEHMEVYEAEGYDKKESMKRVAADRGLSKRDVYNMLL